MDGSGTSRASGHINTEAHVARRTISNSAVDDVIFNHIRSRSNRC